MGAIRAQQGRRRLLTLTQTRPARAETAHLTVGSQPLTPSAASMSVWLMAPCSMVSAMNAAAHFS